MLKVFLLATAALLGATTLLTAQNLADVARAEAARRKTVKGQVKVYTNETLRGADGGEAPQAPPAQAPATAPASGSTAKPAAQTGAKPAAPAADAKDEKLWR